MLIKFLNLKWTVIITIINLFKKQLDLNWTI